MIRAPSLVARALLGCLCACAPAQTRPDAGEHDDDAGPPSRAPLECGALPAGVAAGHVGLDDDTVVGPARAVVLMGGGPEVDDAMRAFVEGAGGGDVLVLRASGSTESYLPYLYDELAPDPAPSAVTVLRLDEASAGAHEAVTCRVEAAEAVWLAGGDQSAYLVEWPAPLHDALAALPLRAGCIGGTSAGAMSLGELAFDARYGSVTSEEALAGPTGSLVSVSRSPFAQPELDGVVVDTHFSQREREGRLLAFLARARALDGGDVVLGVGLDEEAALVIAGGGYEVHAPFQTSAWLYRFGGSATLDDGRALAMDGVERARLDDGAGGAWPIEWDALERTALVVVDGVVEAQ